MTTTIPDAETIPASVGGRSYDVLFRDGRPRAVFLMSSAEAPFRRTVRRIWRAEGGAGPGPVTREAVRLAAMRRESGPTTGSETSPGTES
jgi:hypothetical protein